MDKRANNDEEEHKRLQERYGQAMRPYLKLIDAYGFMLSQLAKQPCNDLVMRCTLMPSTHFIITTGTVTAATQLADKAKDLSLHITICLLTIHAM